MPTVEWSATFTATLPNTDLSGDKIILPQSALEQLLAASARLSSGADHTASFSSFTAFDQQNPYANPRQPISHSNSQHLPNPLMFHLVNEENGKTVYAGIREFSASENHVLLSPYLMEALGITADQLTPPYDITSSTDTANTNAKPSAVPHITIHAKQPPKGTYVRLRPLEAGYNPDDWKALLERQLRESFTTLSNGASLSVRGVRGETFRFLIDQFRPACDGICVVDTDLEVDIEALNEEQARETMRQIIASAQTAPAAAGGSSVGQELNIWKAVDGRVLPGDYVDYELPSWARSRALEVEISGLDGEHGVDLYVSPKSSRQRASPRESEYVFGAFAFPETESGVKRITILPTNVELDEAEALLISVHGYSDHLPSAESNSLPRPFRIRAKNITTSHNDTGHLATDEAREGHGPDEDQCGNCRQWVPKRTMALHENFCRRNNIACPECGSVFQKASVEWEEHWHCPHDVANGSSQRSKLKHDYMHHTQRQCPACPFTTNSLADLARHRTSLCPGKVILCRFCHLEVPQEGDPFNPSAETLLSGLSAHELADGARTTDCHLCSKIIRLRDMATHLKHHEIEKAHRPKPAVCRNANCGRTLHGVGKNGAVGIGTRAGQGPGNDIGLCSLCFSPLYVSLHDPEGKAMKRRIERKYLSQMMTGCGKRWCRNEWCKMGRLNTSLEAKGSSAQAVLPIIKPLVDAFMDTQAPMYFCVDESNQRRRMFAEILASDKAWDQEWCIASCEVVGPDMDKAREWLMNWAPMRE
ncbi:putative ubiquitin fusion degradation protein [Rosellinia necatrix]|uniref:Putative ubiquitin fusion degradation protein n=1 Tax=Rosellinia necatrix TaxID=77044 RepID=A0A1W2TXD4_ROSNE|nr:putative ubiquitin fusion degradation protein [Rosellinia necatrix]